jgi:hypothetical protein
MVIRMKATSIESSFMFFKAVALYRFRLDSDFAISCFVKGTMFEDVHYHVYGVIHGAHRIKLC